MRPRLPWIRLAPLPFAIAILLAACPSGGPQGQSDGSPGEEVTEIGDLGGIEQLQQMFNEDAGTTRLLLLMSPT